MHYQHFGLSRGHETFSGETASAIKQQKKNKSEVGGALFLQATALIWLGFFCLLIPTGSLMGSHRTAFVDFGTQWNTRCVCLAVLLHLSGLTLGNKWGVLLVQNKKNGFLLDAEATVGVGDREGVEEKEVEWQRRRFVRLKVEVDSCKMWCSALLIFGEVVSYGRPPPHRGFSCNAGTTKDVEWLEEMCSFGTLFPPLFFFFFLTFCANFSLKECVWYSIFLGFPHGSCGLGTYLNIYSWHYVDKICNPSYHLTHRSQSKTARLCIWGKQTVFWFFFVLFFCRLANVSGGHFDRPEFGRGGGVCAVMHGWSHTLATNQGCSPRMKTFSQNQNYCKIMVDSAIFCLKMDCIFIGQFRDPAVGPYLMPLKAEVDSCKIWCNILLIFCEVLPYGHPQIAFSHCRN